VPTAASTDASVLAREANNDADEERVATLTAQQVVASNEEEELLHPSTADVAQTKADHGAEIAELESKIDQLEKEMRADIESISTAKVWTSRKLCSKKV
jgi:hypothetical protein